MQAIILAAGMGRRLKKLTQDRTKCMVKVNGIPLIDRMMRQLDQLKLNRIIVVVGYHGEELIEHVRSLNCKTELCFVDNPIYDKTNNIYSLALAKDYLLQDDTLLLESDLIFEDSLLRCLVEDPRDSLVLVDRFASWMDGTCVRIDEDDRIIGFIPGKQVDFSQTHDHYKTVNLYKFSQDFSQSHYVPFLDAYRKALGENVYYEQVLRVITLLDEPVIQAKRLEPTQKWYEIDDEQDLDIASTLFEEDPDRKLELFQKRFGGYWRYPRLLDYCYLVNPFYPPKRLVDELQANFPRLLAEYPSGQAVNALVAAKSFYLSFDMVAVGNGAAELIKSCLEKSMGKLAYIRPTFEEYPNRLPEERKVAFIPTKEDFSYSVDELLAFLEGEAPEQFLLINSDNPSGHYLCAEDVNRLASYCEEKSIRFILDESFVDFADEEMASHLNEDWLEAHPHCLLIKSISKSFGVAGLRLGIAASANRELIQALRKDLSIWNINSMGEFYLQVMEKYEKDYKEGLVKLRETRHSMGEALSQFKSLRVFPSQANFFMVELLDGLKSRDLSAKLLAEHDLFIKDLANKLALRPSDEGRQFIRLSIRRPEENERLIAALRQVLEG